MTIRDLMNELGLSVRETARRLGVSDVEAGRMARGLVAPPDSFEARLRAAGPTASAPFGQNDGLARVQRMVLDMMGVDAYLDEPMPTAPYTPREPMPGRPGVVTVEATPEFAKALREAVDAAERDPKPGGLHPDTRGLVRALLDRDEG